MKPRTRTLPRVFEKSSDLTFTSTRTLLQYGHATGKLAVRGAVPVDGDVMELLLDARDAQERNKLLSDTAYGRFTAEATNLTEFEAGLDAARANAVNLLAEAQMDPSFEAYFRVTAAYQAGSEHEYFAEKMELAQATGVAFLVQTTRLEIDCANVRLLMRKRAAGMSAQELADKDSLIREGSLGTAQLLRAYRSTEREGGDDGGSVALHELAVELTKLGPFRAVDPAALEDVYTLDIALRGVQERNLARALRLGVGPETVVAYVLRVYSETDLLRALMVGLDNKVDRQLLRRYVVVE